MKDTMVLSYHHRWFLTILIHTAATITQPYFYAAANTAFLDEAILSDLLHHPTTCSSTTASNTTFTFTFPDTNLGAEWDPEAVGFEEGLFQAMMSHVDDNGNKSWDIRIGKSGNIYSHFVGDMYGETMPPQVDGTPWVDEVSQMVSVNLDLNQNPNSRFCPNEETDCAKYFVHQAGAYATDSPYTDSSPVYSPSLAKHCSGNACSFASWGTQAHLATPFVSHIMYITRFTNCGDGIIEHTQMIHNFAPTTSSASDYDYTYFNAGWGGVRASNLPYALEPRNGNQELVYENPNTVDYLPLCRWGIDSVTGGSAGRAEDKNLNQLGGYTTFVGDGLFVNRTIQVQTWCKKPSGCDSTNIETCMQESCTDDEASTKNYTRISLGVRAIPNGPKCRLHNLANPYGGYVSLICNLRYDNTFGRTKPYASNPDPCAPWKDSRIAFYNTATGATLEVAYVRHWSWNLGSFDVRFSVFIKNTGSEALDEATSMVNSMFESGSSLIPITLKTVHMSPVKPWCRKPTGCDADTASTCMVQSCTEYEIANLGYTRIALGIPPEGPDCQFDDTPNPYQGLVALECNLRTSQNFGYIADAHETNPIGLYRAYSGMTLEIAYVKHWSQNVDDLKVYFSVYIEDDGIAGEARQQAVDMVNNIFSNSGATTVPLEIRSLSETGIEPVPTSYNPAALPTFTYVYGQGEDYSNGVAGYGRRRIGSAVDTRDYTVFTVNWMGGARLKAGDTYYNRGFMFSSELGSVETTATNLSDKVDIDEIGLEAWHPRTIGIYQDSKSFAAIAASSANGTSTACSGTSLVCSGTSTPQQGHSPFFYVTCGASAYFGPDPYHFTPPFANSFPAHGDVVRECVLVTTGPGQDHGGYINIMVNSGNGFVEVGTPNKLYEPNEVVLDQCFALVAGIRISSQDVDSWTGSFLLSRDNKVSYSAMNCNDCTGLTVTAGTIVVDGDSDGADLASTQCLDGINGNTCTLSTQGLQCILATTGSEEEDSGYVSIMVNSGNGLVEVSTPTKLYETNEAVLDQCFPNILAIQVNKDSWTGSVLLSTDGKLSYSAMAAVPTATPQVLHYLVACGASLYDVCTGQSEVAHVDDLHEVRCCSDTSKSNWQLDYTGNCLDTLGRDVWAKSDIGGCHEVNHADAEAICTNAGARLCTAEELLADCAAATGCGFDDDMVWSSTATDTMAPTISAVPTATPQYLVACGASIYDVCTGQSEVAQVDDLHEVRCCSDSRKRRWRLDYTGNCFNTLERKVWATSNIGGCHEVNHADAEVICTNAGARLCTAEELLADCAAASGCGFDDDMIWSSTAISMPAPIDSAVPSTMPTMHDANQAPTQCPDGHTCTLSLPRSCIIVTTGAEEEDSGYVDIFVNSGDGNGLIKISKPNKIYALAEVVVDHCWDYLVAVQVQNLNDDGWTGTIGLSTDNKKTYSTMTCDDCTGLKDTADPIIVDGNDDGTAAAGTHCINGTKCTFPVNLICIIITTGSAQYNDGYVDVFVDSGNGYVQLSQSNKIYGLAEVVVDDCFSEVVGVQVRNQDVNAWTGSVRLSKDNKVSYRAMTCDDCTGTKDTADPIVVGGDGDGVIAAESQCLDGKNCTFSYHVPPTTAVSKVRSYACEDEDVTVRPTWKLMGWFDAIDSGCAGLETSTYDETICGGVF